MKADSDCKLSLESENIICFLMLANVNQLTLFLLIFFLQKIVSFFALPCSNRLYNFSSFISSVTCLAYDKKMGYSWQKCRMKIFKVNFDLSFTVNLSSCQFLRRLSCNVLSTMPKCTFPLKYIVSNQAIQAAFGLKSAKICLSIKNCLCVIKNTFNLPMLVIIF